MADVKEPTLAELAAQMAKMQETIAEQAKTIVDLKGKVTETAIGDKKEELPTIPAEKVEKDGKQYAWQLPHFVLPIYGKVTAEEAALSDEMIDLILKFPGQGILKEQV